MTDDEMFFVTFLGGIILFLLVFVVIDWLGQRQDRRSGQQPAAEDRSS